MNPNEAEVPTGFRSKSQQRKAITEEPKTPVLRPRKQDIVMSTMNEGNSYCCNYRKKYKLTEHESKAGELSSTKIAGPKRKLMNDEQEQWDEISAMKTENLNDEGRQMVKTGLSKAKATGIGELSSIMPVVETLKEGLTNAIATDKHKTSDSTMPLLMVKEEPEAPDGLSKAKATGIGELSSVMLVVETLKEGLTNAIATSKPKTSDSTIPLLMVKEEPKVPDEAINIPSSLEEETKPVIEHYIPKQGGDLLSELCDPPGVPDMSRLTAEMLQAYELAIAAVKNGLISFLTSAKPSDVALMITQANIAFSFLKGVYADCSSLYNVVRSYILHCSQFSAAEKELNENIQAVKLVSYYEDFVRRSTEAAMAVSNIEANLVKATKYFLTLEARVLETRQLLEKLEGELGHRSKRVADLEAEKIRRVKALAAVDAKVQGIVVEAEEARTTLKGILHRRETAKAAMDRTRAQLSS